MKIRDIMAVKNHHVLTVEPNKTIQDAIKILVENNIGALVVTDKQSKPIGIISERDILRECAQRDSTLRKRRVKSVMTTKLIVGDPDDEIAYVLSIMTNNRIRHMPIVAAEEMVGIITIGDLVKAQLDEKEYDNRYLKQYMFGS